MASNANTGGSLPPPMRARLTRELDRLQKDPPPGIAAYAPNAADPSNLRSQITGPPGTPYENGIFLISIRFTNRYPFEPPRVRFVTPVHHPNVDSAGRICLDTLKSPPAGSWSPAVSLPSLLTTLRALLSDPNPDDALVPEIADMYKSEPKLWFEKARRVTQQEATAERVAALEAELDGGNRTGKGKKAENADAAPASANAKMEEENEEKKKADDDQKQQSMKEPAATEPNPAEESEDNAADHGNKRSADGEKEEGRGGKRQRLDPASENAAATSTATAAATAEEVGTSSAAASAATATSSLEQ